MDKQLKKKLLKNGVYEKEYVEIIDLLKQDEKINILLDGCIEYVPITTAIALQTTSDAFLNSFIYKCKEVFYSMMETKNTET